MSSMIATLRFEFALTQIFLIHFLNFQLSIEGLAIASFFQEIMFSSNNDVKIIICILSTRSF